jgi:hypothetical protein
MLAWKKTKTGTVYAVHKKDKYELTVTPVYASRSFSPKTEIYFRDGKSIQRRPQPREVLLRLLKNGKRIHQIPVYQQVQVFLWDRELSEEQVQANSDRVKKAKQTIKTIAEQWVNKELPVQEKKEKPSKARMKWVSDIAAETARAIKRARRKASQVTSLAKEPASLSVSDVPVTREQYSGVAPEERSGAALKRLYTPTQIDPCPYTPEDAKFSTLYKWAEKVRDYYEMRGRLPTVGYLIYCVLHAFRKPERATKAADRIRAIYSDEYRRFTTSLRMMIDYKPPEPKKEVKEKKPQKVKEKKSVEKDSWGYRKNTEAAKINAVLTSTPKSIKQLRKEGRVERVISSHLSTLVRKKLVKKTPDNKYRLRKGVKPAV